MYRLLVVDDEEIITDSLARMLESVDRFELDVYKAYSVPEALDYLNRYAFDIVITDIEMPGMSGIDLLREIHEAWPACQVIILTGHDDFDYAYDALRYQALSYVLKSEGDEALLAAAARAIETIEKETKTIELLSRAEEARRYAPLLRQNLLRSILWGGEARVRSAPEERGELERDFRRFEIALDLFSPVMLLAARFDGELRGNMISSVDLSFREKTGHALRSEIGWTNENAIVWIVQPLDGASVVRAQAAVKGMAEKLQRFCARILKVQVSFVFDPSPAPWDALAGRFTQLRFVAVNSLDPHAGIAIAEIDYFLSGFAGKNAPDFHSSAFQEVIGYKDILEKVFSSLALDDPGGLYAAAAALCRIPLVNRGSPPGFDSLECAAALNLALISYITKHGLSELLGGNTALRVFLDSAGKGLDIERIEQFALLAEQLIRLNSREHRQVQNTLTDRLLSYIGSHLDADLSLCALSEKVYLNPAYLSRRFKEITGKNIGDTVAEMRIAEACRLLRETGQKINAVAQAVGYESAAFTKLFKRKTGMTPQEYRDMPVL
jgi:two-component system response regulator YesN